MDLKPYLDAAQKADEKAQSVMADINAAFLLDTEDGRAKALELRPALDEAQKQAKEANQLYVSMRDASSASSEAAKLFIPAGAASAANAASASKEMKREEFAALPADQQLAFVKSGGKVTD